MIHLFYWILTVWASRDQKSRWIAGSFDLLKEVPRHGTKRLWTSNLEDSISQEGERILSAIYWTFIISSFHSTFHFYERDRPTVFYQHKLCCTGYLSIGLHSMEWLLVWVIDYYDYELKWGNTIVTSYSLWPIAEYCQPLLTLHLLLFGIYWGQFINYEALYYRYHWG